MGKKGKKTGKGAEKTAAKTEKKFNTKLKKKLAAKGEEDIETLLTQFEEEDLKKNAVIEEVVSPPSKRSAFTIISHPDKDQLILFGGEFFNGTQTLLYNDLYFYNIKNDRWLQVISPGGPQPRCSHQMVTLQQGGGQLWVFGGEFTSPSQSQFYHYKDLWLFHLGTKKWEKVQYKGCPPSSRSGHRMVAIKKLLLIFGGFHDNLREYKYYNDVHLFNTETYTWHKLDVAGSSPCPRSGCQMVALPDGKVLVYGGYSKQKVKKDVDTGVTHSDMFVLAHDKHDQTGLKWKWQTCKQGGQMEKPPPRCASTMCAFGMDKAVLFGGVCDDEGEEELQGEFFNDLYFLDLNKLSWHKVYLTGKNEKQIEKKKRRRRKKGREGDEDDDIDEDSEEDEDEIIKNVESNLEAMSVDVATETEVVKIDGVFTVTIGPKQSTAISLLERAEAGKGEEAFVPPPRMNAGLAVKRGVLYMYGGMFEDGDKQLTLNDFHYLDLHRLEEWQTIKALQASDLEWFESESESDSDSDSDQSEDEMQVDE